MKTISNKTAEDIIRWLPELQPLRRGEQHRIHARINQEIRTSSYRGA